jgi:hypothetical protein
VEVAVNDDGDEKNGPADGNEYDCDPQTHESEPDIMATQENAGTTAASAIFVPLPDFSSLSPDALLWYAMQVAVTQYVPDTRLPIAAGNFANEVLTVVLQVRSGNLPIHLQNVGICLCRT